MDRDIPPYWLPRPSFKVTGELETRFETFYTSQIAPAKGNFTDAPPAPKWVFLNWLVDTKPILLHGSGNLNITLFEPRSPNDNSPDDFSKQKAVFAAGDGIWSIFYAVIDRENHRLRMLNGALQFDLGQGHFTSTRYFFSLTESALAQKPWREGAVYVLPKDGFIQQPPYRLAGRRVLGPHFASPKSVAPLAKVRVSPDDFPFLNQVRAHDNDEVMAKAAQEPFFRGWTEFWQVITWR